MQHIIGARQNYAWGSSDGIASVLGEKNTGDTPFAEYWLGAHPNGPTTLPTGVTLAEHVQADPSVLGQVGRERYGNRLPFLLKLLSAKQALSIQAHPSRSMAEEGFAAENAAGIPLGAPHRNYRDDWPKPEAIVALSGFNALCGFRDPLRTRELVAELGVPAADVFLAPLTDDNGIEDVFLRIHRQKADVLPIIDALVTAATARTPEGTRDEFSDLCDTICTTAADYPQDPGILAALLLNRVRLQPGQGLFLDAGNIHAYLSGTAVEIMSNSDNVLRGGLTPKHVDVDELARVVRFTPEEPRIVTWVNESPGTDRFPAPFDEFALWKIRDTALPAENSPRIALALRPAELHAGSDTLELGQGHAAFIDAGETIKVHGEILLASHGL